jgi:hypothetical protein
MYLRFFIFFVLLSVVFLASGTHSFPCMNGSHRIRASAGDQLRNQMAILVERTCIKEYEIGSERIHASHCRLRVISGGRASLYQTLLCLVQHDKRLSGITS